MDILIVNENSNKALYEQIEDQIKEMILDGRLAEDTLLPSVRALAQQLGVSIITTRRAYTDLESQGFVQTVPAKGTFVSHRYLARLRNMGLDRLNEILRSYVYLGQALGLSEEELQSMVHDIYQTDMNSDPEIRQLMKLMRRRNL